MDIRIYADCKTDLERSEFFRSGRAWKTGIVAKAIQDDIADAFYAKATEAGIHPAKTPMEGGFSLEKFMPNIDPETAKAMGEMFDEMEGAKGFLASQGTRNRTERNERRTMYSEGILGDGAAILEDGVMVPIQTVVERLNERDKFAEALDRIVIIWFKLHNYQAYSIEVAKIAKTARMR